MSLSPRSIFLRHPSPRHCEHDQRSPVSESGSDGSSTLTVSSTSDSSRSRERVKAEESEYQDIELDDLPIPLTRTYSTDTLVRPPSTCSKIPEYLTSSTITDDKSKGLSTEENIHPTPDYKSVSLRWPFIVFILALIAGLFAFLEYQIHDLPPPHYSMIKVEDPEPEAKRIPDPRPPEDEYPKPPGGIHTKCGWEAPSWTLEHIDDPSCDGFTCEHSPEFCEGTTGNKSDVACMRTLMIEYITTFTTDDESWCPCQLFTPFENWGDGGSLMEPDYVYDSTDRGCRSVMLAIQSFNHYKTTELGLKTVVPRDGALYSALRARTETLTTPPLPITGYWAYPRTRREDGEILLPLVSRTAGKETADAFGNKVRPTDSALFPDKFYSRVYPGAEYVPSGCWAEFVWHSDHFITHPLMEPCTDITTISYETVWWPLPLMRPGASTPIMFPVPITTTTSTSSSETPVGKVSSTSSTAEVRTSTAPLPVCTSCEDGKPKIPVASSSSSSDPVRATDSATPTSGSSEPVNTSRQQDPTEVLLATGGSSSTSTTAEQNSTPTTDIPSVIVISSGSTVLTTHVTTQASSSSSPVPTPPFLSPIQVSMPADTNGNSTFQLPQPGRPSPRPRPQGPIHPSAQSTFYNLRSETSYLMASVIPVLLATLLSIPIQVFTSSLCRTFPFRALTAFSGPPSANLENSSTGAPAKDTLLLSLSGSGNGNPFEPILVSLRFLSRYKDPLPLISVILSLLAGVILVPVSSEVIRLEFTTQCSPSFTNGYADANGGPTFSDNLLGAGPGGAGPNSRMCAFGVRKEGELIRVAEGILIALAGLVLMTGVILSRWKSGVGSEAWSIAGMATLLGSERSGVLGRMLRSLPNVAGSQKKHPSSDGNEKDEMKDLDAQMESLLKDKDFRLGYHLADSRRPDVKEWEYGLQMITPMEKEKDDDKSIKLTTRDPPTRTSSTDDNIGTSGKIWRKAMAAVTCKNMELALRILALVFTTGLLILILYYECTVAPDTPFEAFMNSQGFGVRILFTAFGTVITAYWSYYFAYISEPQIYHQLAASSHRTTSSKDGISIGTSTEKGHAPSTAQSQKGLPANSSILLTPPFNIFVGLYRSFPRSTLLSRLFRPKTSEDSNDNSQQRVKGQTLTFHISLATLLAKFTPILLSNIPFSNAVTWKIHEACTWLAVAFLLYMVLVLVASLLLPYKAQFISAMKERLGCETTENGTRNVPFMPLKVDTMAGNLYYLCHSAMVRDFEGLLELSTQERDRLVCGIGRRYFFGEMVPSSDLGTGLDKEGCSTTQDNRDGNGKGQKPGLWYQNMKERVGEDDSHKHEGLKRVVGVGYC